VTWWRFRYLSGSSPGGIQALLVLRHENAVLRRNAGRIRYQPGDRAWFAALTPFIPRRCWAEVFPVTLLAWHRKLAARSNSGVITPDSIADSPRLRRSERRLARSSMPA
jgi:hypothetical protein